MYLNITVKLMHLRLYFYNENSVKDPRIEFANWVCKKATAD